MHKEYILLNGFRKAKKGFSAGFHVPLNHDTGFILRTQIYAVYADHFARVGRALSATNADLRRSDRADVKYKHSYNNTPTLR